MLKRNEIDKILASIKAPLDHPLFYPRLFALLAKKNREERKKGGDPLLQVAAEEFEELSRQVERSKIQESCSVRNVLRSRQLAELLVDPKGEINTHLIPSLISHFQENLYSLGPQRQYDAQRQEHLLKVLKLLHGQKEFVVLLKKFSRPFSNKLAEELIQQTLQLPSTAVINDVHTRQAVLSAWFCYLRQNVGSCFATAPAEIIHDEQPKQFLQDMLDLITMGRLKRTFGGVEYSVPLSPSWGSGELKKPLLVRNSKKGIIPEICHSPALIAAFESIGFLKHEETLKQKISLIEGWILPMLPSSASSFSILTAEEMIRTILLQTLGITEKELHEFEMRPKGMLQTQLIMHTPKTARNSGGIGAKCANFIILFEAAKNVFKSFADHALLKSWEFTLASFSDTKSDFARWNLYSSLGLKTNEPGGIGQCIYQTIEHKLDIVNREVKEIQYEYEMVYTQVKTLESRLRHASNENEMQWLKIDHQGRANELFFLQERRDQAQARASALVSLHDHLYKLYVDLFNDYFQEVYDAELQEVTTSPFDDSPAGFRLLYKHGRSNTSQWTRIQNQYEFIDSLAAFFVATEPQIAHFFEGKHIEKDLSDLVTSLINHVKTKEFLEGAFHRMAAAHNAPIIKDPLDHLDQIKKKPWVYTSGGTMNSLVSCYFRLDDKPKEVEKWVENETELLVYFADTLKRIPHKLLEPFLENKKSSLLMQSPTHAFLLKPAASPFKEAWTNDEFTYTYIRDRFILPAETFVEGLLLTDPMIRYLMDHLSEKLPENYQPRFKAAFYPIKGPLNPIFFRQHLVDMLEQDRGLRHGSQPVLSPDEIDHFLYSALPFFPISELKKRLQKILELVPGLTSDKINQVFELADQIPFSFGEYSIMSAKQLQDIVKALIFLSNQKTSSSVDYHFHVSLAAQKLGYAMPVPLIFADSNWVKEMFGFVVSPGTGRLELWRLDYTGSIGYPMTSWKQWVDGSRSDLKWGIYTKPLEYGQ